MKKLFLPIVIIAITVLPAIAKTKVIAEVDDVRFNGIVYEDGTHHIEGLVFFVPSEKKANDIGVKIVRAGEADHLCLQIGEEIYYLRADLDKTNMKKTVRITEDTNGNYEVTAFVKVFDRKIERILNNWREEKNTEKVYLLDSDQFEIP